MLSQLYSLFGTSKPIIGMIHLAGSDLKDKIQRGLDELRIYEQEGVHGAIIEDYHGGFLDVRDMLEESAKRNFKIVRGVNVLRNPYSSFLLAHQNGAKFVQFDTVQSPYLDLNQYNYERQKYPDIKVLGGVGFKYIRPTGRPLSLDIAEAKSRCEIIVTTGDGTGIETPMEKLRQYKQIMQDFPLIVGAGVDLDNICEQLTIADGAIIGSAFKPNKNTKEKIDPALVQTIMQKYFSYINR